MKRDLVGTKTWTFEPGHTSAEFRVRHMMVTWVRGNFKDVHGTLAFDEDDLKTLRVDVRIDAKNLWTGEPDRDKHLKSSDFLDVAKHREIRFVGKAGEITGDHDLRVKGKLTIRGVSRPVTLDVTYLGQWQTPWWEDGVDKGPKTRAGFVATARINRYDFGVSWNDKLVRGGIVVGKDVYITLDAEAILDDAKKRTTHPSRSKTTKRRIRS
jgi:polyisoprenoid-binding protein YceI